MNKGFTLIELSIVLVIIGLLVAGITGGQSLIRAAELQSVVKDTQQFKTALNTFSLQYNSLPGDLSNASEYWPDCDPTPPIGRPCDGNDDGEIGLFLGVAADNPHEIFRAWQHLALAGLLPGEFTGLGVGLGNFTVTPGSNAPASKLEGGAYWMAEWNSAIATGFATPNVSRRDGLAIYLGAEDPFFGGVYHLGGLLSPADARVIDKKADDGNPDSGDVLSMSGGLGFLPTATDTCFVPAAAPTAYDLTNTEKHCMMAFFI